MSFRVLASERVTSGSASSFPHQEPHLLLGLHLKEHEDEDEKWQGPELVQLRVYVARGAVKGKGDLLDQSAAQEAYDSYQSKLGTNLQEHAETRVLWLARWSHFIKQGREEPRSHKCQC